MIEKKMQLAPKRTFISALGQGVGDLSHKPIDIHNRQFKVIRDLGSSAKKILKIYVIKLNVILYLSHVMRKLVYVLCKQQRRRSACASAQSDQQLCCSLLRQYNTSTCYGWNFKTLASLCSLAGWFESYPKTGFLVTGLILCWWILWWWHQKSKKCLITWAMEITSISGWISFKPFYNHLKFRPVI